jgi:hypothetical protein
VKSWIVSGLAAPVSAGMFVSQCAEAISIAFGFGMSRAMPCQTARTAPGWMACIGEPWERNRTGSAIANLLIRQS